MADYELTGAKWGNGAVGTPGGQVTWSFATVAGAFYAFDAQITGALQHLVRAAFDRWESLANVDFVEVADSAATKIRLGMDAIDGRYNTIGEARYSFTSQGSLTKAEIRFDTAEVFSTDPATTTATNYYALALHEIGHAIGLDHSTNASTIMYPYLGPQTELDNFDVDGIVALYGRSARTFGSSGNDTFNGSRGADLYNGQLGNDTVVAGFGDDEIYGNEGNDVLYGNQGFDTLFGGQHMDTIFGGQEADEIYGNFENDELFGNFANDYIHGGQGNDHLHGGQDNDTLVGGLGNDELNGGAGADVLTGGDGADTFVFNVGQAVGDTITDFNPLEDRLNLVAFGADARVSILDSSHLRITSPRGSEVINVNTVGLLDVLDVI